MRKSKIGKPKVGSVGFLKRKADKVFSEYIRRKDAVRGIATCVTCKTTAPWKKMQNGHYIPRNHLATRYLIENCHVQCVGCNMFKNGSMDEYALYLIDKYGDTILDKLNKLKRQVLKMSSVDYQNLIDTYTAKLKELDGL